MRERVIIQLIFLSRFSILYLPIFVAETTEDIKKIGNDDYPLYFDEDSEEEKEDYIIKATDALIIAGKIVRVVRIAKIIF